MFAFPQTVTLQGTIESRKVSHYRFAHPVDGAIVFVIVLKFSRRSVAVQSLADGGYSLFVA